MKVLYKFLSALQLKVVEEYLCSCEEWTKRMLQKLSRRRNKWGREVLKMKERKWIDMKKNELQFYLCLGIKRRTLSLSLKNFNINLL